MTMKRYTPEELAEVLRLHKLWAQDEEGGERADLRGVNLWGANGEKMKIVSMRVFTGLYPYQCWAVVADDGVPWVRMGCLWKSAEAWDRIGIRASNPGEFPDDGSEKCERRVRAFEFVRTEAMLMARKA